jgi:tetratricopeptide (TPR) repeat protein
MRSAVFRGSGCLAFVLPLALIGGILPARASADSVYVQGLSYDNVTITGISAGQLNFTSVSGNADVRDLAKVQRIHVDGENAFNDAEDAYAAGKFSDAVDGYLTTTRSTTRDWLKDYVATRLVDAANKANRFDAATTAYIAMMQKNPAAAAHVRPAMPATDSTYLDTAISQVNDALTASGITDEQRVALLQFEVDLYNTKKDAQGADAAEATLDEILAKDPNNPIAQQANARRKLQAATTALAAKKYQEAIGDIESNKQLFTDPAQQADALYTIAEARMGLLGAGNDPTALKDVALAYMRVVADFKDVPGKPHVADALLKTAQIEERLAEPDVAGRVYQQVADQFPSDPAAAVAKQNLDRLKSVTK